jgi:hypothetical protein
LYNPRQFKTLTGVFCFDMLCNMKAIAAMSENRAIGKTGGL